MISKLPAVSFGLVAFALLTGYTTHAGSTPAQKCAAAKEKAAAKKAATKLGCYATAAVKGALVSSDCLAKAEMKFSTTFEKVEAKGGCISSGDAASIEKHVNDFVSSVVNAEPTATTTTSTTLPCNGFGGGCLSSADCCSPGNCVQCTGLPIGFFCCQ